MGAVESSSDGNSPTFLYEPTSPNSYDPCLSEIKTNAACSSWMNDAVSNPEPSSDCSSESSHCSLSCDEGHGLQGGFCATDSHESELHVVHTLGECSDGLSDDLLFREHDAILSWLAAQDTEGGNRHAVDQLTMLPAAFSESPPIRNAYIRAYIQHAYHGATHVAVNEFLRGQKALLQYIKDSFSPALFPDLDSMAIMLPAVERRLGLCTGPYLFYYFICSECWAPYHIEELATLDSPKCTAKLCSGQLYSMKTLGSGDQKRVPFKVIPCANLEAVLQRILLRPGKFDHMQHWRQDGDEPGAIPPIEEAEHYKSHSVDAKMHDIHDGWGWRAIEAWVTRTYDSKGHVIEGTRKKHRQRFVALPCGLVFIFSIDW